MLENRPGPRPDEEWIDRLAPKVADLRAALEWVRPDVVADRSGAVLDDTHLRLTMLFEPYTVDVDTYVVRRASGRDDVSSFSQALVLTYLHTADGTADAGRWVSFRELPNGAFYHQAFQSYAADRLVRKWGLDPSGFERACRSLGGTPVSFGDAAFALPVLPRVELAVVYWLGDEDLSSRASILFDANAPHYMVLDGLAILGSHLVGRILSE